MPIPTPTLFPVYGQAWPCPVAFFNQTGGLVTGWNGNVTNLTIIPDGGTPVTVGTPNTVCVENAGSGMGVFSLTAAQMQCAMLQISITVSNANTNQFVWVLFPFDNRQRQGNATQQATFKVEDLFNDMWAVCLNRIVETGTQELVSLANTDPNVGANQKFGRSTTNNGQSGAIAAQLQYPPA